MQNAEYLGVYFVNVKDSHEKYIKLTTYIHIPLTREIY